MAIAHDVLSENSATDNVSFTADASWSHAASGTAKGVVVVITQPLSSADEVSGVTYGGVALSRQKFQQRTVTEQMAVYIYFLGSGIPTGTQTVAVTLTTQTAAAKHGMAFTMTAAAGNNTAVDAVSGDGNLGIVANPSITVTHTGTLAGWAGYCGHTYGANSVVTTGLQTGETYRAGHDPGAAVAMVYTRHAGADAASSTYGYTTLASDDQNLAAIVVKEVPFTDASAENAAATATAEQPTAEVAPNAEVATAVATGNDASVEIGGGGTNAPAEAAEAIGSGADASTFVDPNAEAAAATASGADVSAEVAPNAEAVAVVATGNDAAAEIGPNAEVATAVATGNDASASVEVNAEPALAVASALDATVQTTGATNANAECATATATAHDAAASIEAAVEAALATALALDPNLALDVNAEAAASVAAALDATVPSIVSGLPGQAHGPLPLLVGSARPPTLAGIAGGIT